MVEVKSAAVVIPAYNEEENISSLVRDVRSVIPNVIVVDDGSADRTASRAGEAGATVLKNPANMGKGAAIMNGVRWCFEKGFSPVILMDADRQHLPDRIKDFLVLHEKEDCDLILGTRMARAENMPFVRRATNRFTSWVISRMTGCRLSDTQCGFRLYGKRLLELHCCTDFQCRRFDYETEVILYSAKKKFKISEVAVPTIYISDRVSRINPVKDTIRWFSALRRISKRIKQMKWD